MLRLSNVHDYSIKISGGKLTGSVSGIDIEYDGLNFRIGPINIIAYVGLNKIEITIIDDIPNMDYVEMQAVGTTAYVQFSWLKIKIDLEKKIINAYGEHNDLFLSLTLPDECQMTLGGSAG